MDMHPPCAGCARGLVGHRLWEHATPEQRTAWLDAGLARRGGEHWCHACAVRLRRASGTSIITIHPRRCIECDCHMIHDKAWREADKDQRTDWRARNFERAAGESCARCYRAAYDAGRRNTSEGRPPVMNESPRVLLDGRWTLCPTRRVQVWEAA